MEHPQIDDEHVVDRYLGGELPEAEVERFEEHLFECEACLTAVEWGEELRRGVRTVDAAADVDVNSELTQREEARGAAKPWRTATAGRGIFAALALALLALGVLAARQNAELARLRGASPEPVAGLSEPTADFQVASLGLVRNGGATEIRLDPERDALLLSLELPRIQAASYSATMLDSAGKVLWHGSDLEPGLYGGLMLAVPMSDLAPGSYSVTLEAASADALEFAFRVVSVRPGAG